MRNLWKKAVSLSLVLSMVLSIGMVSNAAGSASTQPVQKGSSASAGSAVVNGVRARTSGVTVSAVDEVRYAEALSKLGSANGLRTILGNRYREGTSLSLLAVVDVYSPVKPLTVEFDVQGVARNDTVYVLHCYDGANWEVITPNAVGNGYISATFSSFSPVAFVKAVKSSTTDNSGKSPKTGEF